ncbi:PilZ domain-containing protein [Petrachloros mirabilis]
MEAQKVDRESSCSGVSNRHRRHPRVRISAPFVCSISPRRSWNWLKRTPIDLGVVYDLSVRGARVSSEAPIKPGDEVRLTLRLPRQIREAEIAVATVCWSKDHFFGLAFRRLSADAHERLKRFMTIASKLMI